MVELGCCSIYWYKLKRENDAKTVIECEIYFVLGCAAVILIGGYNKLPYCYAVPDYGVGSIAMASPSPSGITLLLKAWSGGEQDALEQLLPLVYHELHRLAHRYMGRERHGHTLQSTALVHEAYERLVNLQDVNWQNRAHFFAISAQLMRRILVDYARSRRFSKRGGEACHVALNEAVAVFRDRRNDVVALDDALGTLARMDSRKAQVVELRFFGGLSVKETAEVLHVSPETVLRDWRLAKAWLLRELSNREEDQD